MNKIEISSVKRGDTMSNYRIISKEYYSNCFIEAIRAKIHNSQIKIYFCKPRIAENGRFQMCHFMWTDGVSDYDFSDLNDEEMPWYKHFVFKGYLRKFKRGFAEQYSTYRNNL